VSIGRQSNPELGRFTGGLHLGLADHLEGEAGKATTRHDYEAREDATRSGPASAG
jgi:hypothetical protein